MSHATIVRIVNSSTPLVVGFIYNSSDERAQKRQIAKPSHPVRRLAGVAHARSSAETREPPATHGRLSTGRTGSGPRGVGAAVEAPCLPGSLDLGSPVPPLEPLSRHLTVKIARWSASGRSATPAPPGRRRWSIQSRSRSAGWDRIDQRMWVPGGLHAEGHLLLLHQGQKQHKVTSCADLETRRTPHSDVGPSTRILRPETRVDGPTSAGANGWAQQLRPQPERSRSRNGRQAAPRSDGERPGRRQSRIGHVTLASAQPT